MADSFYKLEDEAFPSFLSRTLDSTGGRATLSNVTLGSGPGLPVAASTVAKIRPGTDNREDVEASYLQGKDVQETNQSSVGEQPRFALSFKDDLDNAEDFIAAHRLSDVLVKISLDESAPRSRSSGFGVPVQTGSVCGQPTEVATDLSTGLLTFAQFGQKSGADTKVLPAAAEEDNVQSEGVESDRFSGSNSSFLANEQLMSVDSMNSDITDDDDTGLNNLPEDQLELYFSKLVPPAMQRGRVEGQEIPVTGVGGGADDVSEASCLEAEQRRHQFLDLYDQEDFQMPDVRLAATGMDSCPASDEDTEDELETARSSSTRTRLLPSTSRQLVGESNHPSFRPGLEGGSSDDESSAGRGGPSLLPGIEHRRSAEGQVINSPVAGAGGGGDGSSGSEESGNDGGVSTIPLAVSSVQTTYDALRGLGIVGSSLSSGDEDAENLNDLPERGRIHLPRYTEMGDRIGPVGTGEASSSLVVSQRLAANRNMAQERQEALDVMESSDSGPAADHTLDSVYLRRPEESANLPVSPHQESYQLLSQAPLLDCDKDEEEEGLDEPDGARPSLALRGGPCGTVPASEASDGSSDDGNLLSTSLEPKYFSQSFNQEQDDSDEGWNYGPDNLEQEFQQGGNATHSVVYQNEEGQWVTDLAYYASFEKEMEGKMVENEEQLQHEDFLPASEAMDKILKDQEEFEKEHQFMQEEQIQPACSSSILHESSWKAPTNSSILMRASQVSSEFRQGDESYLRLSLGQFFGQRSEALGCLGSTDGDEVKRPSFGYIITSPEKREPFPLIRPSEFSPEHGSPNNATVELCEADKTLSPEDLDKTFDATSERKPPRGSTGRSGSEHRAVGAALLGNHSGVSPDSNSSQLMLSISTIASAIANASISTDPSQLAAMIMDLSKKRRAGNRPESGGSSTEEPTDARKAFPDLDHSARVGDVSAFDIEKYLKKGDMSGTSDSSEGHTTFDLSAWADSQSSSQRNAQAGCSVKQGRETQEFPSSPRAEEKDKISDVTVETQGSSAAPVCKTLSAAKSGVLKRSSIPRPSLSSVGKPVDPRRSPSHKSPDKRKVAAASFNRTSSSAGRTFVEKEVAMGEVDLLTSNMSSSESTPNKEQSSSRTSPSSQRMRNVGQELRDKPNESPENKPPALPHNPTNEHSGISGQTSPQDPSSGVLNCFPELNMEQCSFRPSTSPLTHSSPSQPSIPGADSARSPSSKAGLSDRRPDLSPESTCSSPSLSRLTYISLNDGTVVPSSDRHERGSSVNLSTTIVRFSPTPPVEADGPSNLDVVGAPRSLSNAQPEHCKSLDPLPARRCKSPELPRSGSALSCTCSQSGGSAGSRSHRPLSDSNVRKLSKMDSGYSSNLNIQQPSSSAAPPGSQWGLRMPPPYSAEGLHYVPVPSFKPPCSGVIDLPHKEDIQSLLSRRSLVNAQIPLQYLGPDVPLHPGAFHVGPTGNGVYGVSSTGISTSDLTLRHLRPTSGPLGIPGAAGSHPLPIPHQSRHEMGMMGKAYGHYGGEALVTGGLEDLRGQVVVPEELRFPHACCVGIASQTSLSLFNPSERWQQVSITVVSLAIDGEKVDGLLYQWLMVKNKTIIGPKSTEEQKVLFVPPQPGVYQFILSVCSWPASAEAELAARANLFARRVVLVAVAENPALEIQVNTSGCLDFGDLPGGGAKCLPLRVLNRSHVTVPIRLVISANATAWRCFTFSKQPVTMTSEVTQQAVTSASSPSVMNHVMHASYGENPESFTVWVHFKAPQKFVASSDLGPADEYSARVDVEVDSPGPSHVIRSVPLKARSGTARVHAPKDLQTVHLCAPEGKRSEQTVPLKNAGNIDVALKLKINGNEEDFSVTPSELSLSVGEERGITASFKAQSNRKRKESLLTILVLPSGPQYEVTLKGEAVSPGSRKPGPPALSGDVPPILSNKQFVAWGGVTLGRAVQQKLVLRNNSTSSTQQLRLLIRGQDQDCFQLQSMFSPDECLTRHGELSIRPGDDVTVHLLFAPTRVACMLAKLEIKQSGVRPSQPGVKFIIPLSGYGGTSNIILEDQRKWGDGYVATLTDVAVGRVSKACLCVRNTGSRAAFIKAVAFSDVATRSVVEPSVISLAPSQFVLKERTQEVITVLMKSTQRERSLCESAEAPLATVCLFCGDEVSRQQYRRLLQSKPEAAQKALSENSLLKIIKFYEKFLGEEIIKEDNDLPLRPNEAHIFYSSMSKVLVSLLGQKSTSCDEEQSSKLLLPAVGHDSEAEGSHHPSDTSSSLVLPNGSVSLDVLPVRGPQGPALRVSEPSSEVTQSESWTIHPQQLVLAAPTINGPSSTSQVQIQNNSSRELNFDLSWPAHCLTVTPQHGRIEPQSHLQILISPNPSLASRSTPLPWSGQMYLQCDGQQKLIKVQIRRDLALDVSAAPTDPALMALSPQAATPVLPVARISSQPSFTPQPFQVEIGNKTVTFPTTPSGETSEAQLEVQNGEVEVRWYLSSFAPPYVKGVDDTEDVYRATYTAFRCSRVSGTLGANQKMQVPVTFLPRERGTYVQFWDLECHPVSDPQQKTRIRFQLSGTGLRSGPLEGPQEGDCSLVRTETTAKSRKRADSSAPRTSQEEAVRRGVYSPQDLYTFPDTHVGESSTLKVNVRNNSSDTHELKFVKPMEPFHMKHLEYSLRSQHYVKLPVQFKPTTAGRHTGVLLVQSETSGSLVVQLSGEALP
ncbi:centrosomal protein of 192 kDa isoform X2 [Nothobranchius furzeri]|uniref:centrosomal protein of 192 kDa isoform X2 n=1 Tax=Nothobranchius furzeri TaxID=105023 RepID=UPI00077D3FC4|nr:centrosomal protein of 192 kDa isoform X2 [Nothobranchius furzeri]